LTVETTRSAVKPLSPDYVGHGGVLAGAGRRAGLAAWRLPFRK
jgi:hypothetical protein